MQIIGGIAAGIIPTDLKNVPPHLNEFWHALRPTLITIADTHPALGSARHFGLIGAVSIYHARMSRFLRPKTETRAACHCIGILLLCWRTSRTAKGKCSGNRTERRTGDRAGTMISRLAARLRRHSRLPCGALALLKISECTIGATHGRRGTMPSIMTW